MSDAMSSDDPRRQQLDEVIGAFLVALDAGQNPDPREWLSRHPDLSPELADFFADRQRLDPLFEPLRTPPSEQADSKTINQERSDGSSEDTVAGDPGDRAAAEPLPKATRVRYFGDYELQKVLGEGGMGLVYKARQISLNRPVALKMIRAVRFASDDDLRRFHNEAEAVAQLDHPNIVPIFEVGQFEDQHYFSMKLIGGESLDKRLKEYTARPRRAAELVEVAARAIHHAHQRGILHRDLKPANILLDAEGQPHITDFGLSRRVENDSELTRSGAILGTPAYMAPEQASGHRGAVTTSTDVYGLGAILYALLTGRAPFGGTTVLDTLGQVRERPPDSPRKLNSRIPGDLEVICLKCLEKDPRRRYASADALREELRHWLAGQPITARPVGNTAMLWMWARRHPAAAGLLTISFAATILTIAAGFLVAYNGELKHANHEIEESRAKLQIAYDSEAAARQQAETAEKRASEQHSIALKALGEARNAIDLSNRLLAGMEIALEQLKGPTATSLPPADEPGFREAVREKQASAERVAYAVEESFQAMMHGKTPSYLNAAAVRLMRNEASRSADTVDGGGNESEAMRELRGHYDLILGRLLAVKVRCYEFNWACARLKKDPPKFRNPRANSWKLVPDQQMQYSDKAAEAGLAGIALLKRVVEQHRGTPWAALAQRELSQPFGFRWVEASTEPVTRQGATSNLDHGQSIVTHVDMSRCTRDDENSSGGTLNAAIQDALGAVLYRAGRYSDAIRRLEEAARGRNGLEEPVNVLFLAMAHQRVGHRKDARLWLERFRHLRPITHPDSRWGEPELRLLLDEAEAVILYDPIFPADPFAH